MMTLEQERDHAAAATGGEATLPVHPSPAPALPHLSPRTMKSRRSRTPVRQSKVCGSNLTESDSSVLLGCRQRLRSPRNSPISGHRSPLGKRSTQEPDSRPGSACTSVGREGSRRGSETGVAQKQKKLACEVPPLPPPPDPRSPPRVPPQPGSQDSAESVNLMDLSSDTEGGLGRSDSGSGPTMDVEYTPLSPHAFPSPLTSPVWPTQSVPQTSPTAMTPRSGGCSPKRTPPAVLSPVLVGMSVVGDVTPPDTIPLLAAPESSIDSAMSPGDTVPLLDPTDEDEAVTTPRDYPVLSGLSALRLPSQSTSPAVTPEPSGLCAFVSPAASVAGLPVAGLPLPELSPSSPATLPVTARTLPLLGFSPASLSSPDSGSGDALSRRDGTSPGQRSGAASPAPLSTPDLRVDMFDADYEGWNTGPRGSVEVSTPPLQHSAFPAITPEDLTPAELREFDMKYGSPHHGRSRSIRSLARPTLLALPAERPRLTSLPASGEERDEDYYRLRHFSITGTRIINRGDSFRARRTRSNTSVASDASSRAASNTTTTTTTITTTTTTTTTTTILPPPPSLLLPLLPPPLPPPLPAPPAPLDAPPGVTQSCLSGSLLVPGARPVTSLEGGASTSFMATLEGACRSLAPGLPPAITLSCDNVSCITDNCAWSHPCSLGTSAASSAASSQASSASEMVTPYRVVMLGAPGVGKTALVHQFMTSEHINAYDNSLDEEYGEHSVSVMLDGEESEIMFVDHPADEMTVENYLGTYEPHAFVVVLSVTERASYQRAEEILQYLWRLDVMTNKGVILVANKTDIVRARCVTSKEGSGLADSYDCKYIETSSGFNHQVDELLVGILKQIRLKTRPADLPKKRSTRRKKYRGSKTSASLKVKSFLTKVCGKEPKSKSCENLHVL